MDVGTSGGVWGLERGYCMMIGGETEIVEHLDPIFARLAPATRAHLEHPDENRARQRRTRVTFIAALMERGTSSKWCTTELSTG